MKIKNLLIIAAIIGIIAIGTMFSITSSEDQLKLTYGKTTEGGKLDVLTANAEEWYFGANDKVDIIWNRDTFDVSMSSFDVKYNDITKRVYEEEGKNDKTKLIVSIDNDCKKITGYSSSQDINSIDCQNAYPKEISFLDGQLKFKVGSTQCDGYNDCAGIDKYSELLPTINPNITIAVSNEDELRKGGIVDAIELEVTNNFVPINAKVGISVSYERLDGETESFDIVKEVLLEKGKNTIEVGKDLDISGRIIIKPIVKYDVINPMQRVGSQNKNSPPSVKEGTICKYRIDSSSGWRCYDDVLNTITISENKITIDPLAELQLNLDEKIDRVNALKGEITKQISLIDSYGLVLDEKVQIVASLELNLVEQQQMIESLSKNAKEQAQYIKALNLAIDDQLILIQGLQDTINGQSLIIKELEDTAEGQAQYITQLTQNIAEQAEYINNLETNLEKKAALVNALQSENLIQAELIKQMKESFKNQGVILDALDKTIEDDAIIINALSGKIEEQTQIINGMKLQIEKLSALVQELSDSNTQLKEYIVSLESNIANQGEIIANLQISVDEKVQLIKDLTKSLEEEAQMVAQFKNKVAEQEEIIQKLTDSLEEERLLREELAKQKKNQLYLFLVAIALIAGVFYIMGKRFKIRRKK